MSFSFRDEPLSALHRSQFLMLEWYRSQSSYELIMQDCIDLISSLTSNHDYKEPQVFTVQDIFLKS